VDWSFDLLFDDERRLFGRLSVFVGGCELDAVEAVCANGEIPNDDVLDAMSALVDKSLLTAPTADQTRFSQLQTLWEYGRDRLDESDEADTIRATHATFDRLLAEGANDHLRGAAGAAWRDRLTAELANLKTALDWHLAAGNTDAALSMASGMAWLWFINGDFAEGARRLASALGTDGKRLPSWKRPPTPGTATAPPWAPAQLLEPLNGTKRSSP
jgi:predicted ATPase